MKDIVVLISSYNGEKYIQLQIESILKQTLAPRIDILIRDDGSADGTPRLVREMAKESGCIRLIQGENLGLGGSFFQLLREAAGKYRYYCLCDQDDYWLPQKVESAVSLLSREDDRQPLLYACPSFLADENLNRTGKETKKPVRELSFFNIIHQNICTGHNQVLNDAMVQTILEKQMDDSRILFHDQWTTNVAGLKGKILFDSASYALYRMHGANVLGFGGNRLQWLNARIKRAHRKEGAQVSRQMAYFLEVYKDEIPKAQYDEVQRFLTAQEHGFFSRVRYVFSMKLYRQSALETLMMKGLYCIGGYRP